MMKAVGCFVFFVGIMLYSNDREMVVPYAILSGVLFYVLPFIYGKMRASADRARWQKQSEIDRINRENAAEYEHQTALRRERERLDMQAEVRVGELIATLEAQCHADAQKMKQLAAMKAELANRQQSDMASLLGRLEALRAGA